MLVEPYSEKKIKIRLSNTESVSQNIYKYTTLNSNKENKSISSTCNYFLTTNSNTAEKIKILLNDKSKKFVLDVIKTMQCVKHEQSILNNLEIRYNFKGNLNPFLNSTRILENIKQNELIIGEGVVKLDGGGKYNLYFDNDNENVKIFRNCIIAVLCDIVIEIRDDYYLLYIEMKEELFDNNSSSTKVIEIVQEAKEDLCNNNDNQIDEIVQEAKEVSHIKNIIALSKELNNNSVDSNEIIRKIILEGYKELNK